MSNLKVLMLNGSPKANGNTAVALQWLCTERTLQDGEDRQIF